MNFASNTSAFGCSLCKEKGHIAAKCPKNPTLPASQLSQLLAQAAPVKFNLQAANSVDLIAYELLSTKFGYQRAVTKNGCPYLIVADASMSDVFFMFVGRYGYNIGMNDPEIQDAKAIKGYVDGFELCKSGISLHDMITGGVYASIPPVLYGGQPYRVSLPYDHNIVMTNYIADFTFNTLN